MADGEATAHSPYVAALLANIDGGEEVREMLRLVKEDVALRTRDEQVELDIWYLLVFNA